MKVLALLLVLQATPQPQDAPLEWNHHLGAALRQAIQKKQQIVLLFSSKTCGWCRRLQEETFKDAQVKALLAARVLVHLDVDEASEIAQSLGATAVPDVRLYTEEGLPLASQRGYLPADPFRAASFEEFKNQSEALFFKRKLAENEGNVKRTAERLGMQRSHLYKKLDRFGLK